MPLSRTLCPMLLSAHMLPHSALSITRNLRGSPIQPYGGPGLGLIARSTGPGSHPRDTATQFSMKPSLLAGVDAGVLGPDGRLRENPLGNPPHRSK